MTYSTNDVCVRDSPNPVTLDTGYTAAGTVEGNSPPSMRDITLHNVRVSGGGKISFNGYAKDFYRVGVTLDNVLLTDSGRLYLCHSPCRSYLWAWTSQSKACRRSRFDFAGKARQRKTRILRRQVRAVPARVTVTAWRSGDTMIPFFSGETCWNFCRAYSTETATFEVSPASTCAEHPLTIFKESNAESDAPCCGNRRSPYRCCHEGGYLCGDCKHSAGPK